MGQSFPKTEGLENFKVTMYNLIFPFEEDFGELRIYDSIFNID